MRPFLLLATRADDVAADGEYAAFLSYSGLDERNLRRVRLEQAPLVAFDPDEWSGVFLGGGPFNVSDEPAAKSAVQLRVEADLARLLDVVVARDTPFLGACYGIGTLGSHEGAIVDQRYAEPIGAVEVTLTSAGRQDPLFADLPTTFQAFVGHKEAINTLPTHAVHLASSPTCPIQAFRIGRHAYATQFHPELDVAGLCARIEVYRHAGYFEPDRAESLMAAARVADVTHPAAILRRFVARYSAAHQVA